MKPAIKTYLFAIMILLVADVGYIVSCTQKDTLLPAPAPVAQSGNAKLDFITDPKVSFDKAHSNVGWETAYLGGLSLLTGRFDTLGFKSFHFDEAVPANTNFEGWVWVNRVNTSEPGRDKGCLQTTFGVNTGMTTEAANVAIVKSKKVEFSNDDGYNVTFDFTFHGVTKELTGKFFYDGKIAAATRNTYGFSLYFQFLAKTDFGIVSNNIANLVTIKCNAVFRQTL
jgi:polyisoprenoid-binding protein YceI